MLIRDHPQSTQAIRGKEWVKAKAYIYCFYDAMLLFKNIQEEKGCLKITKFERTYFMDWSVYFTLWLVLISFQWNYGAIITK